MNVVVVYVGQRSLPNLEVGLESGTWGFKQNQDAYRDITPGDTVVLASGFSGGSPRKDATDWVRERVANIRVGRVTSSSYRSDEPLWPDEKSGEARYPFRFTFDFLFERSNVSLAPDGPLGSDVSLALRSSAIVQGRAYVLADPPGFTLAADDGAGPSPTPAPSAPAAATPADVLTSFESGLADAGLRFPPDLPMRFLAGLMAKPFAILTGLSGSGKSQLAIALGQWLGAEHRYISAVRPDWTGAEALFGYENLLLPPDAGRHAWSVPNELRFMLQAAANPSDPYLLILDEMNLAHVERYFADVLSGMESRAEVLPNLGQETDGAWRVPADGPARVPLPSNLLVVGTVNVDETTYQFSPKVLDRATTIEFRVATDDLSGAAPDLSRIEPAPASLRRMLLPADVATTTVSAGLRKWIEDLHRHLTERGREFGHRTYQEMLRFASLVLEMRPATADARVLDFLVMQKVLPRVNGSARELQPLMAALVDFARDPDGAAGATGEPVLTLSAEKLGRMVAELDATHFTSF